MFSATKVVVAGAIVALFGGFLLSGVLTQPSDDRPPIVGASASATTEAEPTDAATSEPETTSEVEADDPTTTTDLLLGVDLVTEEVEPGVYRVLSDGMRDLSLPLAPVEYSAYGYRVAATDDGGIGIVDTFFEPNQRRPRPIAVVGYILGDDGDLSGGGEFGNEFEEFSPLDRDRRRQGPNGTDLYYSDVSSDGTLWGVEWPLDDLTSVTLHRRTDGRWSSFDVSAEVGIPPEDGLPMGLRVGLDDGAWLTPGTDLAAIEYGIATGEAPVPGEPYDIGCGGLKHFDGQAWSSFLDGVCIFDFAIADDGGVWARGGPIEEEEEEGLK